MEQITVQNTHSGNGSPGGERGSGNGDQLRKHAISLYVANKPGVLVRIALLFARRGYNIDSLVVSEADDPHYSQMNIEASGDAKTLDQILKQLNKLVDVVHAKDNTGADVIAREIALIKLRCPHDQRSEILQVAYAFEAETLDLTESTITLQVSGESQKLDSIHTVFSKYGILEIVRSGKIIIARGEHSTS